MLGCDVSLFHISMRYIKTIIFIIGLFTAANKLLAQYDAIFKIPFPQQYHALDSMVDVLTKKDSVNALSVIEEIGKAAEQTHNEQIILNFKRALLNFKYIHSHDLHDNLYLDKLITDSKQLLEEVNEKKYPEIAAMIHVTLGNTFYYKVNKYTLAFTHFISAYNLFKNISNEEFPDRQYSQYAIALAYFQFNDFENAIVLGKEIESLYPVKNHISLFTNQMLGLSYFNLKKYDSALIYFQWVLNNTHYSTNAIAWKGIAMGSLGNVYFIQNQFSQAASYLEPAVKYTVEGNVPDNTAAFAAHLSTIYLKQKNIPLAKQYIDIALQAAHQANTVTNYFAVYQSLSDYYKETGNTTMALLYLDSSIVFKDSLVKIHDVNLKYQGEMAAENERRMQDQKFYEQDVSKQKIIRNALVAFIILSMFIALLFYNRYRLKIKHREQQLISEKQLAEAELINATSKLTEFTKSIIEKNELIEKVSTEIERLSKENSQLQNQQAETALPGINNDTLQRLQESVLLTDDDWKNFTQLFDKVYTGFFIRLKEKLPGLSPAETRFIALSKLKLNNKEMAAMLGVSTDAIRQARSRLKKKLNHADDTVMEEAIGSI